VSWLVFSPDFTFETVLALRESFRSSINAMIELTTNTGQLTLAARRVNQRIGG